MYQKHFLFFILLALSSSAFAKKSDSSYYSSFYFRLTTKWKGTDRSLDILNDGNKNNQPILSDTGNYSGQHWKITPAPRDPGYYRFTTEWQGDEASLGIVNDKYNDNKPILERSSGSNAQLWKITPIRRMPGYYRLTTKWQGKYFSLDVINDGINDNKLILSETGPYSGQYWKISKTTTPIPSPTKLVWKSGRSGLPNGAVSGGSENGAALYICSGDYKDGHHPGKVVGTNCNIGYGGSEILLSSFDVLVNQGSSDGLAWEPSHNGYVPRGAVSGGKENDTTLYICRVSHGGGTHPGKLVGESCNIGYGGSEVSHSDYEILIKK